MSNANNMLVTRGEGLVEAEVDNEIVALHIENGTCYSFNPTAARIWKLIEQPKTLTDLCGVLASEFKVDPARCEADVRALLDDLAADGLVRLS
jgi:PqqD family protein of HPr-rel-A system